MSLNFLTLPEVAREVGLSESRVYRLQDELQVFRIAGRLVVDRSVVEQFLERRRSVQSLDSCE